MALPPDTEYLLFRIKGGIGLEGFLSKIDEASIKTVFQEAFNELMSKINSNAFTLTGTNGSFYMWPKTHVSTKPSELQENASCKSILKYVTTEVSDLHQQDSMEQSSKVLLKIINLQIQFEMTRPQIVGRIVIQRRNTQTHYKLTLPVDVLVFANPEDPWGMLQDHFTDAVITQLASMSKCIQRYTKGKTVPIPQAYHFKLPNKPTLTTVIYPAGISDETLEPQRKELHAELGLTSVPYLRRPMAFNFPGEEVVSDYLLNVHEHLPLPDPEQFKIYLLSGSYEFHHCMQDNENDEGWGALYHCLQIIISWFKYQGYTAKPVPTLKELQEMLSNMNKDFAKVVMAEEWLKAEHLQAVLRHFKIINSLTEIRSKAEEPRELVPHFRHHGTPIVIWNKVIFSKPKAYILLGMAEDAKLNTRKVLTLSAMYTGPDEIPKIIEEAVGWKGKEFWDEMELFSLILPQRPMGV
ncbi:ufm1-specific protease 2-like [Scyliorhinus torazame]|uniref:ufm1-specific protease 2-like n=1 Tax=Scyliorhinus torazame TaxID=75743 RepID=UPI003B5B9D9D